MILISTVTDTSWHSNFLPFSNYVSGVPMLLYSAFKKILALTPCAPSSCPDDIISLPITPAVFLGLIVLKLNAFN